MRLFQCEEFDRLFVRFPVPPRPGVNRVNINEGSRLLEPMGHRTTATYILYTDGGGIPAFLATIVNKQCIAKLFDALRARVLGQKLALF